MSHRRMKIKTKIEQQNKFFECLFNGTIFDIWHERQDLQISSVHIGEDQQRAGFDHIEQEYHEFVSLSLRQHISDYRRLKILLRLVELHKFERHDHRL